MRAKSTKINGKEYILCLSPRCLCEITDKFGSIEKMFSAVGVGEEDSELSSVERFENAAWVYHRMLTAGKMYAKCNGIDYNEPPTLEQMVYGVDMDEYMVMMGDIFACVKNDMTPEVETEGEKDPTATRQSAVNG